MQAHDLCSHFLTWQCRIRQIAMREDGGRPAQGMCPKVVNADGQVLAERIVVLLIRENPHESTEFLKFQVQKHNAPEDIYKKSLTFLQSTHYHRAIEFSDEMTGLFAPDSELVKQFLIEGKVVLQFTQFNQRYALPCNVRVLSQHEPAHQATLWHNRVFNPHLGDDVSIIGFQPDWEEAVQLLERARQA